ncbi:MAG TPA: hypothetical protein VK461_10485 [Acidimicrobiales bacterium]|nr:hypothetical protein [Acidimicrobiales bacterium]
MLVELTVVLVEELVVLVELPVVVVGLTVVVVALVVVVGLTVVVVGFAVVVVGLTVVVVGLAVVVVTNPVTVGLGSEASASSADVELEEELVVAVGLDVPGQNKNSGAVACGAVEFGAARYDWWREPADVGAESAGTLVTDTPSTSSTWAGTVVVEATPGVGASSSTFVTRSRVPADGSASHTMQTPTTPKPARPAALAARALPVRCRRPPSAPFTERLSARRRDELRLVRRSGEL